MSYDKTLKDALQLSPNERAKLVEIVLQSLSEPNPHVQSMWEKEAIRRYDEVQQGNAIVRDMDDVLKKYGR